MNKLPLILIAFLLTMMFCKITLDPQLTHSLILQNWINFFLQIIMYILMFTLVFVLVNMAARMPKHAILLLGMALLFSYAFISFTHSIPDDEFLITYYSYHALLAGQNPYTQNWSAQLQPLLSQYRLVPSILTNGSIVATFDYPALYLLVQMPFFALLKPTALTIGHYLIPLEYMVFFTIFLLSYYFMRREYPNSPFARSAIVLMAITTILFSSDIILLMLSLIFLMFTSFGKKYDWLLLGLMASLQQELWILVILFIAYKARKNIPQAVYTATMAMIVFLVINGVFIAWNPYAYVHSFLLAFNLLPNTIAPIGAIFVILGLPHLVFGVAFILASIALCLIILKYPLPMKWILLLSAIPYIFVAHGLPIYFALPFVSFALIPEMK